MHPAKQRAKAILDKLNGKTNPVVVEVGVFVGALSVQLLSQRPDLKLIMVDSWGDNDSQEYKDTNDFHANASSEQQAQWEAQARKIADDFKGRVEVIKSLSVDAVKQVKNKVDLVFIDADHSYEGCKADIKAWEGKVKKGGWLSGHDYENNEADFKFGVTPAVDEYLAESGKELFLGENYTWFTKC